MPQDMEYRFVDRLTSPNLIPLTSLKALVQGYVFNCKCEGKSEKTIRFYADNLNHFLWWLEQQGLSDDPTQVNPNHIRGFLTYVATEPVRWGGTSTTAFRPASQITVRHYYRVLFTFFKWWQQEQLVIDNPVDRIKTPKIEQRVVQALSPQEVQTLLLHCPPKSPLGCRNRAILMMLLDTGVRVSELASLSITDVHGDKLKCL